MKAVSLHDAVYQVFSKERPATAEERDFFALVHKKPGVSAGEARLSRGGKGIASMIGRMVESRRDNFQHFLKAKRKKSDILFERDYSGGSIRYTLKSEAAAALEKLGVV